MLNFAPCGFDGVPPGHRATCLFLPRGGSTASNYSALQMFNLMDRLPSSMPLRNRKRTRLGCAAPCSHAERRQCQFHKSAVFEGRERAQAPSVSSRGSQYKSPSANCAELEEQIKHVKSDKSPDPRLPPPLWASVLAADSEMAERFGASCGLRASSVDTDAEPAASHKPQREILERDQVNELQEQLKTSGTYLTEATAEAVRLEEETHKAMPQVRPPETSKLPTLREILSDFAASVAQLGWVAASLWLCEGFTRGLSATAEVRHENIVQIYEIAATPSGDPLIVMEYCAGGAGGTHSPAEPSGTCPCPPSVPPPPGVEHGLSFSEIKYVSRQLLDATGHLHKHGIIHRDLATKNVLFNLSGEIKVCDFGISRMAFGQDEEFGHISAKDLENPNMIVSLPYRAIELLLGDAKYGPALDVWSVGCIFAEIICSCAGRRQPFFGGSIESPNKSPTAMVEEIFTILGRPTSSTWPGLKRLPLFDSFNTARVAAATSHRERAEGERRGDEPALLQRWFCSGEGKCADVKYRLTESCFDLLGGLFTLCPADRISTDEALSHPFFTQEPRARARGRLLGQAARPRGRVWAGSATARGAREACARNGGTGARQTHTPDRTGHGRAARQTAPARRAGTARRAAAARQTSTADRRAEHRSAADWHGGPRGHGRLALQTPGALALLGHKGHSASGIRCAGELPSAPVAGQQHPSARARSAGAASATSEPDGRSLPQSVICKCMEFSEVIAITAITDDLATRRASTANARMASIAMAANARGPWVDKRALRDAMPENSKTQVKKSDAFDASDRTVGALKKVRDSMEAAEMALSSLVGILQAKLAGRKPSWLGILRRNAALHADAHCINVATAKPAVLRRAQRERRLEVRAARESDSAEGFEGKLRAEAPVFVPSFVIVESPFLRQRGRGGPGAFSAPWAWASIGSKPKALCFRFQAGAGCRPLVAARALRRLWGWLSPRADEATSAGSGGPAAAAAPVAAPGAGGGAEPDEPPARTAGSAQDASQAAPLESAGPPPDILQFDAGVYFVEEEEGAMTLDVMRLGTMRGKCSVKYKTVDGSAIAGQRYEAVQGELHFSEKDTCKSITIPIIDDGQWCTTLEFSVLLYDPVGCELGRYLYTSRVKVIDGDTFPTNRFNDVIKEHGLRGLTQGDCGVKPVELLIEYFKLNYSNLAVKSMTIATLAIDQLQNLYFLLTVNLLKYVADDVLAQGADPAAFLVPNSLESTLISVGALYLVPYGLLNGLDIWKSQLGLPEVSKAYLRQNVFRKFMNYDADSRGKVPSSERVLAMTSDIDDIVESGYMKALEIVKITGKLGVSSFFILQENPDGLGPIAFRIFTLATLAFVAVNGDESVRVQEAISKQEGRMVATVQDSAAKYRLIADYLMRPKIQDELERNVHELSKASIPAQTLECVNEYYPGWLANVLTAAYIIYGGQQVVQGDLQIGAFLATSGVIKDVGEGFKDIFTSLISISKAVEPIQDMTVFMNLPTDLRSNKRVNRQRRSRTKLERSPDRLAELRRRTGTQFPTDAIPISVDGVSFSYPGATAPAIERFQVSVPQGKLVAVVGPRREGKSTVLRLLGLVETPSEGEIFVPAHLRILHVSQIPMLLDAPPWENLAVGRRYWKDAEFESLRVSASAWGSSPHWFSTSRTQGWSSWRRAEPRCGRSGGRSPSAAATRLSATSAAPLSTTLRCSSSTGRPCCCRTPPPRPCWGCCVSSWTAAGSSCRRTRAAGGGPAPPLRASRSLGVWSWPTSCGASAGASSPRYRSRPSRTC
ncbi:unnamed protein product [Prorocentrum cordatum]|uniref:Cyclin-dependent kinase 2 homolog n=1 Tax=Prorocentrum cordatum TaxID=2364126 RepID=A0ABN9SRC0_9DINO|nr:unnamed protein product [Polarella glacialis]